MTRITKWSLNQPPNHDPSRATLEPGSPFRVGKIVIYVNSYLHKLHNVKTKMTHHFTVNSMKVFNWAFPMQVQHFTRPCPLHTSHLLTKK